MKKLGRKAIALSLCLVVGMSVLTTGCGKGSSATETKDVTSGLSKETKGDISIMTWAGNSKYYEDIGHMELAAKDLTSSNVAQVYAVAKKFNETYPNIKINLYAKTGDPDQVGTNSWDQEIENFKTDHGKYPDIWGSTNVTNDIKKGIVADLSVYKDDTTYQSYNKSLMSNLNYYGFQGGLPSYTIPWGIWVNKSLATENNIDVPSTDWTIDEYTDFFTAADGKTFWGDKATPTDIINMGVSTLNKQIKEKGTIDLNNDQVKDILKYIPKWAKKTVNVAEGAGNLSTEIAAESGAYSWYYFCNNRLLTNIEDPWYLTTAADPNAVSDLGVVKATDWDIYPFPSTDNCGNTIKTVMDPICIHNYAMDDGNKEWSKSEEQKRLVSYTFATFWTASTEAKQAVYDQKWTSAGQEKSAAGDTFPVVTGEKYDEQMEIWNKLPAHQVYKDKEGFQKVVKLFKEGKSWDYVDKCWTSKITEKGEKKDTLYEWNNMWDKEVAGAWQTDADWVDQVKSKLADWNESCNKRIKTATSQFQSALVKYYGMKESDFK